jgi:hypothetical protein
MAAGSYTLYNKAKKYLNTGLIDLDTNVLYDGLYKSTSNASTYTLSNTSELTNPVAAGGYTGAKQLGSVVVTAGASAKQIKFDAADSIFTASGGNIGSIMYSVIYASGGKLLCWAKLSTAAFTVTTGNTLTNQYNAAGIFTITSTP